MEQGSFASGRSIGSKLPDTVLLAFAGIVIALAAAWAFLAHPALDDYCLANLSGSPVEIAASIYQSWSGRWLAFLLYGAFFAGKSFLAYWLWPLIGLALWLAAFVILAGWRLGIVALALFIAGMPSQGEGLYWATNVIAYTAPFLLGAIALRAPWPIAAIAGFLSCGLSEFIGAFVLAIAGAERKWRVAAATLIGIAINLAAPGNAVRAEGFHYASLVFTAAHSLRNYDSVLSFIADPRLMLLGLLLMTYPRKEASPWLAPFLAALMLGAFAAMTFRLGGAPPPRILNILYAVAVIGWIAAARSMPLRLDEKLRPLLALGLGLALLTAPNIGAMVRDLPDAMRGAHSASLLDAGGPAWANECQAKYQRLGRS